MISPENPFEIVGSASKRPLSRGKISRLRIQGTQIRKRRRSFVMTLAEFPPINAQDATQNRFCVTQPTEIDENGGEGSFVHSHRSGVRRRHRAAQTKTTACNAQGLPMSATGMLESRKVVVESRVEFS